MKAKTYWLIEEETTDGWRHRRIFIDKEAAFRCYRHLSRRAKAQGGELRESNRPPFYALWHTVYEKEIGVYRYKLTMVRTATEDHLWPNRHS